MAEKYTKSILKSLKDATEIAKVRHNQDLTPEHLLFAMFNDKNPDDSIAYDALGKLTNLNDVVNELDEQINKQNQISGDNIRYGETQSVEMQSLVAQASKEKNILRDDFVTPDAFLLAALQIDGFFKEYLNSVNVTRKEVLKQLLDDRNGSTVTDAAQVRGASILKKYGIDLVQEVKTKSVDPIIGRDAEIREVINILSRKKKNNPLLIGEPGVGKTAIAEGLAQRIVRGDVPDMLRDSKLISLDMASLVSGASARGAFEMRFQAILSEVEKSNGKIILFIDEIHNIVGAGNSKGQMDASNLIKPALARGLVHLIGATTIKEYKEYLEKDGALTRRFAIVNVAEPDEESTLNILRGLRGKYEAFYGVTFHDSALKEAVKVSKRYIPERFLPDKAIELMDAAGSQVKMNISALPVDLDNKIKQKATLLIEKKSLLKETDSESTNKIMNLDLQINRLDQEITVGMNKWNNNLDIIDQLQKYRKNVTDLEKQLTDNSESNFETMRRIRTDLNDNKNKIITLHDKLEGVDDTVTPSVIDNIISNMTGINVNKLVESEKAKLLKLPDTLHENVIGQDDAVNKVSNAIKRARTGLGDPSKPIGSFLFMGSTGVGKTQLAKMLAVALFDSVDTLIRIDMSEYQDKNNITKLIGSPPGYVGYEEGGQLTEAVREHPYSVVLLDEIEKAHPDVMNILLQVLDDGRLTDGKGRTVNFKNTIVILTSNLNADNILAGWVNLEKPIPKPIAYTAKETLSNNFRSELLNRIDDIIIFKPLSKKDQGEIADLYLRNIKKRLLDSNGVTLNVTDKAKSVIVDQSYSKDNGARPLRRYLQATVENLLSDALLKDEIKKGDTVNIIRQRKLDGYGHEQDCLSIGDLEHEDKNITTQQEV